MKGNPSNFKDTSVALTSTIVQVLPVNENRTSLQLFNNGTTTISVGFSPDKMIDIPPKDGIQFMIMTPINAVYASCATAGTLIIWEA